MDEQKALRVMRELVDNGQLTDPDSARGKLLQVAAHLFRNKGFERTTVRDLAGAVGIQSGSIFHHFKSKDEILRAVMEETIRYNTALMRAALAEASNVRERVLALIRCELQSIMGGSGEAMAVLVYEWRSLSEDGQAQVLALRDIYEDIWLQVLGEAKSAGFIRGDVFITRRFLTGALSWTTTWFRADGSMSLDQLADEALILVLEETIISDCMAGRKLAKWAKPPSLNALMRIFRGVGSFDVFANSDGFAAFAGGARGVMGTAVPGRTTGAHRCRTFSALHRAPGIRCRHRFAAATGRGPQRLAKRLSVRAGAHFHSPAFR